MSDQPQPQPQAVSSSPQPWAVEAYADKLMDEVFEDIDRGLDLAETPLDTPVEQYQPVSIQPIQIPPIVMQPIVSMPTADANTVDGEKTKRDRALVWFDRFLIALLATSALAALLLWWIQRGDKLPSWMQATAPAPATEPEPVSLTPEQVRQQDFSDYVIQSLDRIEGRIPGSSDNSVIGDALPQVANSTTATLSIPVDPASSETMLRSLNRIASALERVSARPAPLPAVPGTSTASASKSSTGSRANTNSGGNTRSTATSPRANPTPATPERLPSVRVPAPVVAPPPPAPPIDDGMDYDTRYSDVAANSMPEPDPKAPTSGNAEGNVGRYALVGTLDRGDGERPAALFEVDGAASWVNIGETIGDSDWVVLDVNEDQATIERNGNTQTLSVGEEF